MKLENVTAEIRPRNKWESVDLGVLLTQKNLKFIALAWGTLVVPFFLLILLGAFFWYDSTLLRYDNESLWLYKFAYGIAPFLCVWWLKPLYEKVLLYVFSRRLFGEKLSFSSLLSEWKNIYFKGNLKLLINRRFSLQRCFTLPISELEGLTGAAFKKRQNLLSRNGGDGATSLTIATISLSHLSMFTFYISYVWLTMYGYQSSFIIDQVNLFVDGFFGVHINDDSTPVMLFTLFNYMLILSVFTPFYIGGGFSLYINSRTITEGWDVELAFKRMSNRLQDVRGGKSNILFKTIITFTALFYFIGTQPTAAQEEGNSKIEKIVAGEEFAVDILESEHKIYKKNDKNMPELGFLAGLFSFIVHVIPYLFYLLIVSGVAFLIYLLIKNAHLLKKPTGKINLERLPVKKARTVLGMEVTKESLPEDILAAARLAWESGDKKLALSYLYRGAIAWMVNTAELPILESDTEHDCIKHAKVIEPVEVVQYFVYLTNLWVNLTYGKIPPDEDCIDKLCQQWPFTDQVKISEGGRL